MSVEGHAGDDDEVEVARIGLVLGLQYVKVAYSESCVFAIFHRDDVVADHSGQDDGLFQMPLLKEGLCLHLVGQGAVKHYLLGFDEVRMLFQLGQNFLRLIEKLFFGMRLFQCFDVGAQFFFFHGLKFMAKVRNKLDNTQPKRKKRTFTPEKQEQFEKVFFTVMGVHMSFGHGCGSRKSPLCLGVA